MSSYVLNLVGYAVDETLTVYLSSDASADAAADAATDAASSSRLFFNDIF